MKLHLSRLKAIADKDGRWSFRAGSDAVVDCQLTASTLIAMHEKGMIEILVTHDSSRHPGHLIDCVTAGTLTVAGDDWLLANSKAV